MNPSDVVAYAQQKGLRAAYSNDSFELWFLLHYLFTDSQVTREQYYQKLSELWDSNYKQDGKKYAFYKQIFNRLEADPRADIFRAIQNGRKLFEGQSNLPPADQNPCTKVYELVEELLKYSRK